MMKAAAKLLCLGAALAASACVSVLPEAAPPKPRFHIAPAEAASLSGPSLDWSLVIEDPRATRVYDSVRIAVSPGPGKIEYLAGAEWADRAPRLFQTALAQTFENAGRIIAVGDRLAIPVADIVLQTDIRRMEIDAAASGRPAVVEIYARLSNGKGAVYAARKFEARAEAGSTRPDDVYGAFENVFDDLLTEIVDWTYTEGAAARGPAS
ncbi:ABC-type transport auxiliary lipoprotein family protein [Hyphococcus sp.]|uniref:ABC-type transport auxiliary lipoprotein family protein n=1 Tax=Hyphococcus sp. TaxID=2038636 RepID=UPI003CCBF60B